MSYFSGGPPLWHASGSLHSGPGAHTTVPMSSWTWQDWDAVLAQMRHALRGVGRAKPQPPAISNLDYVLEAGDVALHLRVPCSDEEVAALERRSGWVEQGAITTHGRGASQT